MANARSHGNDLIISQYSMPEFIDPSDTKLHCTDTQNCQMGTFHAEFREEDQDELINNAVIKNLSGLMRCHLEGVGKDFYFNTCF